MGTFAVRRLAVYMNSERRDAMTKNRAKVLKTDDVLVDGTMLARICRLDVRTILKLAEQGIVLRVARGRFAQWESIGNIIEHYRDRASGRESKDGTVDVVKANAALRDSQRRLTDLKIAQLDGTLISLPEVRAAWAEVALHVKQMFLSLPARARFLLSHLSGRDQEVLDRLVRDMLDEVAFKADEPRLPPK